MQLRGVFILAILALPEVLRGGSAAEEARFISNPRQLIYEGKRSGEGYFSKDGKMLIFQSEREEENPFYQIYLLDLETGEVRRVSSGVGKTTCGFLRPDGMEAIFASTHLDPKAMEKQQIELEFRASGKQRRYSWDYDESMDIFAAELDGGANAPSDGCARLRRGRLPFSRRKPNRLHQPARRFSPGEAFAGRPKAV